MYEQIIRGQDILAKLDALRAEFENYTTPIITDVTLLQGMYRLMDTSVRGLPDDRDLRYYYVLISVYLYSPRAFYGQTIERYLRSHIAAVLGISGSLVSNNFSVARFRFDRSQSFRKTTEELIQEVIDGLLPESNAESEDADRR